LSPNTQSAPPTAELRKILGMAAQEMLIVFLKKSRTRRSVARGMGARTTGHPVDVVSSIFISRNCCGNDEVFFEGSRYGSMLNLGKTKDLLTLSQEPNDVSLLEVESVLQETRQYNALCLLYKQVGDNHKLLESWAK
jgi:vacuolar protein sorting-associated protein 3